MHKMEKNTNDKQARQIITYDLIVEILVFIG